MGEDRIRHADELYERAVFGGDRDAPALAERVLDAVEADLALARGRILHARFLADRRPDPRELALFRQAAEVYRRLGDGRGEGEALFWTGTWHQVVAEEYAEAVPLFRRSYELAEAAGDRLTLSYATRHLGFAAEAEGRPQEARERFEESIRLREELGFLPGVAAGKLALADLLRGTGDREAADRLLDEARELAARCGAHGVLGWIEAAPAAD